MKLVPHRTRASCGQESKLWEVTLASAGEQSQTGVSKKHAQPTELVRSGELGKRFTSNKPIHSRQVLERETPAFHWDRGYGPRKLKPTYDGVQRWDATSTFPQRFLVPHPA